MMQENLVSAIKTQNWSEIRCLAFSLPEKEKQRLKKSNYKEWLKVFEKHLSYEEDYVITYLIMCVCDNADEVLKIEKRLDFTSVLSYHTGIEYHMFFLNSQHTQALLDFIHTPQGAYIVEGIQQVYTKSPRSFSFEMLWTLYKERIIPFNEEAFIRNLYDIEFHRTEETKVADYLLQNLELATLVFPHTAKYINYVCHTSLEWHKVFAMLEQKDYFPDRTFINSFFEVLLNPWKKNVLDMYCRWIEGLNPTTEEVVANQYTLFALLSSTTTSLVNFSLKQLQKATTSKGFDFPAFADAFALCFTMQKIAKSQLIGLSILETHYKKQAPTNIAYREQLAVLFTVPDTKLQEKVAALLIAYFSDESLAEIVLPYRDYLKGKAQELCQTLCQNPKTLTKSEYTDCPPSGGTGGIPPLEGVGGGLPLTPPTTWDTLLFLLGDCLREKTPATIDLFFEGLVQLQDQIPADAKKQLAPYLKQMDKHRGGDIASLPILRETLLQCLGEESPYDKREQELFVATLPYLAHKAKWLLKKIQKGSRLPFLSTPTHVPFYIEAETLVNRLLQYETQGVQPDLEDLVVACNRLLFKEVSATAQEKAQQLKGAYSQAIQYILGLTDTITPTDELLPLWTQIARIKHPDSVFEVFENTSVKDIPSAVKPFALDFEVKMRKQSTVTFYYLSLADNWNDNFDARKKSQKAPIPYYNAGICDIGWDSDVLYQCSLSPHYIEAQIARFIASYAKGNEMEDILKMQVPMQMLLDYKLPIYHDGWLYVAVALLFEKRPSRDLANAYIVECLQSGADLSVLAGMIAKLLAENFAPINRFMEFLDMPTRDPKIKDFQKSVVQEYLRLTENVAKKPTNHKKLAELV